MQLELIGQGANSTVYKISEIEVYKDLTTSLDYLGDLELLKEIVHPSFVFPNKLFYDKDKIIGYTMDYVDGNKLTEIDDSINFETFMNILNDFEKAIYELTQQNIKIDDISIDNLLLTKDNKLIAIDTDLYSYNNTYNERDLLVENLRDYNNSLFMFFIKNEYTDNFNEEIKEAYLSLILEKRIRFSQFVKKILNQVETPINTLSDFKTELDSMFSVPKER